MRTILKAFLPLLTPAFSIAQSNTIDSLKQALKREKQDTSWVLLLAELSRATSNAKKLMLYLPGKNKK